MNCSYAYGSQVVDDYDALMACPGPNEFKSPRRSTVLALVYWRAMAERVTELCGFLGEKPPEQVTATFEHQTPVWRGRGKPSHSDLMLEWDGCCVAIEAKYTEGKYQTVVDWLKGGTGDGNRAEVLRGWCEMIAQRTGRPLPVAAVNDLPYQVIHRAAAACGPDVDRRHMVYLVFNPTAEKTEYYETHLKGLRAAIGPGGLGIGLLTVPIEPSSEYSDALARWDQGDRDLSEPIRAGLLNGTLMSFGKSKYDDF